MSAQKTSVVAPADVPQLVAQLAARLGLSNVAREADVCHQSVGKWAKDPGKVRPLISKSITSATLQLGQEIADMVAAINAQHDAQPR